MSPRHSARATRALQKLAEADPTFAALSLWCHHRDVASGPAAATDGKTIHYGPAFEALAFHEQIGLAAHQILHVAFRHAPRAEGLAARLGPGFDRTLFALAADALINETLELAGYALPRPAVLVRELQAEALGQRQDPREAIAAWDAERLYLALTERPGGRGQGSRAGQRPGTGDDPAAEAARAYAKARAFEPDLERAAVAAAPDGAEALGAEDEAEWQSRIARAFEAGRAAGRGIGTLGHLIADRPQLKTPWETVLRRLLTKAVASHPTRAPHRPARRWLALEEAARARGQPGPGFEPGSARVARVPRIAIGLDASASVGAETLARFAGQVSQIARRSGAELCLLVFDTAVRAELWVRPGALDQEMTRLPAASGGGTDFRPVLAAAAARDPSMIVMLTDLDGPTGPAPRPPVLWAVPAGTVPPPAPFGRTLILAG